MRLTPDDFKATKESPFANDRLNRKPQVQGLREIIRAVDGHAVVSIDGPWGSGKTAFVKMCAAQLNELGIQVVDFNAWQESYTNNPLVDLISAVAEKTATKEESAKKTLVSLGWHIAEQASSGWIQRGALQDSDSARFDPWREAHTKVGELKEKLAEVASSSEDEEAGQLVVLVDELDRCRPAYALELIETVKHLFAVDGVVVLLAINREELCHSIQSLYGAEFDTDQYLRRFINLPCTLPPPTSTSLTDFALDFLFSLDIDFRLIGPGGVFDYSIPMLEKIMKAARHNLRDFQQAIFLVAVAMQSKKLDPENLEEVRATNVKAVALIILRALDKAAYLNLAYGDGNAFAAVAAMNRAITEDHQSLADSRKRDEAHEWAEVSLLVETRDRLSISRPEGQEELSPDESFHRQYVEAFVSEFGDTPAVRASGETRAGWIVQNTSIRLREKVRSEAKIDELVGIIDLIGYESADA
ncbi:MAG: P-loop NTPase fold protein [bacterium]|nr:P-loop NTPase fold protein [bacterium]MCY3890699.1 P-loop NTPase fold protein [bacterium]